MVLRCEHILFSLYLTELVEIHSTEKGIIDKIIVKKLRYIYK